MVGHSDEISQFKIIKLLRRVPRNCLRFGAVLFVLFIYFSLRTHEEAGLRQWDSVLLDRGTRTQTKLNTDFKSKGLLINTTGCQLELVEPFDDRYPEIKDRFEVKEEINCAAETPPLTHLQDGILRFDITAKDKFYPGISKCTYKAFFTDKNDKKNVKYGPETELNIQGGNEIKDEYILLNCTSQEGTVLYRNVHQQVIVKTQSDGSPFTDRGPDELNVIGITFESISRLVFLRHCPEIHKYLTETLGGFMLNGFNKVGDNTGPNLYPLITGKHLFDDWKSLLFTPLDDINWIFKEYERKGYATALYEEVTDWKMPSWAKWFRNDPATHHHRPVRIQWHITKPVPLVPSPVCYGPTHRFKTSLDWIREFSLKYKEKKTMALAAFIWAIDTHFDLNGISRVKDIFFNFLKQMEKDGAFNNTVLFLASDHGMRSDRPRDKPSYISTNAGAYEGRLPFGYMVIPKWVQEKYKDAYQNVKENAKNRILSSFDGWRTLKAILNKEYTSPPKPQTVDKKQFGMSIFSPIPESRTCEEAGIAEHWCACGMLKDIPLNDPRAIKAGEILINGINSMLSEGNHSKCVLFKDFKVFDAKLVLPSNDIRISIKAEPVGADFRSTIKLQNNKDLVVTSIERLDMYARFVKCLTDESTTSKFQILPLTCICKDSVNL